MKLIEDYLRMAEEANKLARSAPPNQRKEIQKIAETWEELAQQRQELTAPRQDRERRKTKRTE